MYKPISPNDPTFRLPLQCFWLKLNGSWPLKSNADASSHLWLDFFRLFYLSWSWYVMVSVGITICFQTAFLIQNFGDIVMTTENCCTTFMGALNFVRLVHLHFNSEKFRAILENFVKDIWIVKGTHPRIERDCQQNMKTFSIISLLLCCLILMYCFLPLVVLFIVGLDAPERPFPYKMLFPYDAHRGWPYVLTYIFTAYAGICVVTTLFAEDSMFGFLITYTCGQYRILHERILSIVPDSSAAILERLGPQSASPCDFQREYTKRLNSIAYIHYKLIRFSASLENFFNGILLVNFMISSILICMVGFQLVTGKDMFVGDYIKFIVYISSSLSQLYVLCHNGDTLIQHSTETAQHLYACQWEGETAGQYAKHSQDGAALRRMRHMPYYPADKNFRQNLQIMILCGQRPVKITALKFSTLSLQSFTAILSTSMSYFTLLQTLYYENQ